MEAIKTIKKIKNHQILIDVPDIYENTHAEIIVLLMEPGDENKTDEREEFLAFLQDGPTLSEEEIQRIENVGQELNRWTIQEFS